MKSFAVEDDQQQRLFNAMEMGPITRAKVRWCSKWLDRNLYPFHQRLVAFAIVEDIFSCSSFAAVYWFRNRGILPGLCFSNDLMARNEQLYVRFACLLYDELDEKVTTDCAHAMIREAVDLEKAFFSGKSSRSSQGRNYIPYQSAAALKHSFAGLSAELMAHYIEYIADILLHFLDIPLVYRAQNPVRIWLV